MQCDNACLRDRFTHHLQDMVDCLSQASCGLASGQSRALMHQGFYAASRNPWPCMEGPTAAASLTVGSWRLRRARCRDWPSSSRTPFDAHQRRKHALYDGDRTRSFPCEQTPHGSTQLGSQRSNLHVIYTVASYPLCFPQKTPEMVTRD